MILSFVDIKIFDLRNTGAELVQDSWSGSGRLVVLGAIMTYKPKKLYIA